MSIRTIFPTNLIKNLNCARLQTFVELAVCHRIEFRVKAHSRAKRIVSAGENVASEVTEAQPTSD